MACDYPALAELMAPTIARTLAATEAGDVDARQLLARTVFTASMVLRPLGYVDLATRLAERAQWAAAGADDPAAVAAAEFALAQTALTSGLRARSLTLASRAADAIQGDTTEAGRAWYALLHLQAGLASAALGDTDDAAGHLDEADAVAALVTGDPWRMDLSPANAGVWRVAAVLEGNDPGRAVELARGVDRYTLRTTQRQAHLHTFVARALYLTGDHNGATRAYLEADRLAPAEIRGRGSVQEIVGQMIRDARRQAGSDDLRDLAVRVGVDPLQPAT
ncbi:MAG: XRE family transcriptional regulator, partial [Actinomycetes bacterium]